MKTLITDRTLRGLKPAPLGKRMVVWDTAVPGLCVRVTDKGAVSFCVMRRLKGDTGPPLRRMIGVAWRVPFPARQELPYSLKNARDDARAAILDMSRGLDPKVKWEEEREARAQAKRETFSAAANDFLNEHVAKLKSSNAVRRSFDKYLLPKFGEKPIADITDHDIVHLLRSVAKEKGPYMARHLAAYLSKFFRWAIEQRCYGVKHSPSTEISIKDLLGKPAHRTHVLSDGDLVALWKATAAVGYPAAPFARLLLLTGARRTEVAAMQWNEVDLQKKLWLVPGERMKAGSAHAVPLSAAAAEIFEFLPRWQGPYVFSTTNGERPISSYGDIKAKLDVLMPGVAPWVIHDLRRTVRTGLSALRVPDEVAELVIGHTQKGLHKVYDQHSYLAEKRDALDAWARHVMAIVEPGQSNVVPLKVARDAV